MPYSGPRRRYEVPDQQSVLDRVMALGGNRANTYGGSPVAAGNGGRPVSIDTSYQDEQDRMDAGRARLAMTPGVVQGGSTATYEDPHSPLNQSDSTHFSQFGEDYSYDPTAAAAVQGRSEATAQNEADKVRYNALMTTAGITPRQAARLVYGRGDILDTDPTELRTALAQYERDPSRDTAASAITVGASPSQFPDRFQDVRRGPSGSGEMALPLQNRYDAAPLEMQQFGEQEAIRTRANMAEAQYRDTLRDDPSATLRKNAQQARLALDEARKDGPRPSKIPTQILGTDAKGRAALVPNPAYTKAVADSAAYDQSTVRPLTDRFQALSAGSTAAPASTRATDGATPAATSRKLPPSDTLVQWAKGDANKKAHLAQLGYDVSGIP